ncbi:hypothetical protein NKR23_g11780 [Pleurostoma richardsiae]|uniref:Uncharacterized protein n=1 Tax=Pleurostoma richardsiae TaxID=41990 RepID=A0AA38RGI8_9PEZI|nr:hypothetical protein NKR23_g11780 [Pleurostoma richardsiae]
MRFWETIMSTTNNAAEEQEGPRRGTDAAVGVGIDLGTTNSCIAVYDRATDRTKVIAYQHRDTLYSTVSHDAGSDTFLVGCYPPDEAPPSTQLLYNAKRFIGRNGRDGTLLPDLREEGCFVGVLSGALYHTDEDDIDDGGDLDSDSGTTNGGNLNLELVEKLRGIRVERMIDVAYSHLQLDQHGRQPGHKDDPKALLLGSDDEERKAIDVGLSHLFRFIINYYPPIAEGPSEKGGDPPALATLSKTVRAIYADRPEIPSIESLIAHCFEIMPVAVVDCQMVHPVEVSAGVLKTMVMALREARPDIDASSAASQPIVTVPAYFVATQRSDTKVAARLAHLAAPRLVNEPSAAALGYAWDEARPDAKQATYIVLDLGAGTFDVSVIEVLPQLETDDKSSPRMIATVIATEGDNRLGGYDFTVVMEKLIVEKLKENGKLEQIEKLRRDGELRAKANTAKENIRGKQSYRLRLADVDLEVADEVFIRAADPLFGKIKAIVRSALSEAFKGKSSIRARHPDLCLLVGGASWTVGYKEAVEAIIEAVIPSNVPVILPSNPRTLVATGAAILSAGRVKINDRLSRSLGIEVETSANGNHADSGVRDGSHPSPPRPTRQRNLMDRILERNSHYETPASVTYRNSEDNQERVRISVYEGEHPVAQDNIFLGQFHIDGVTPAPKGTIPIKVTVTADTSGVVQIAAQELGRGTGSEVLGAEPIGKQLLVRERRNWTDKQIEKMAALVSKRFPEKIKVPVAPADQERPRKKRKR